MVSASDATDLAATAQKFLAEYLATAPSPCVTCSFQAEDMVVVHMVRAVLPDVPVIFLETGYHFAETIAYRDRMAAEWKLNLFNVQAEMSVAEQESKFGILNQTAPDRCCGIRKVEPLFRALGGYETWLTGLRREQSKSRTNLQVEEDFTLPGGKVLRKLSPLAEWTARDVWQYAEAHNIPLLPLYEKGYTSIGCEPCTSLPFDSNDPRSGRWSGKKLECGIHIQAQ
ncbi:MAG: phosphoadenylyl-sulfate reductase [Acidobacteriota bacterium]|nr:phosphoadenylyl-sulfate reductase [Acidobacteriota bacterium]